MAENTLIAETTPQSLKKCAMVPFEKALVIAAEFDGTTLKAAGKERFTDH
jgi:hypothetical protein